jgi:hypothetical protein
VFGYDENKTTVAMGRLRSRGEEAGRCRLGMNLGKSRPRFGLLSVPPSTFDVSVNNRFFIMVLDFFLRNALTFFLRLLRKEGFKDKR